MILFNKIYYTVIDRVKSKKITYLLGIKFTTKISNYPILNGKNNHIYIINSETGKKEEITNLPLGLNIEVNGDDNIVEIYTPIGNFNNTKIFISKTKGAQIKFENNVYIPNTFISIYNGKNQNCIIKKYTSIGSTYINIHENSSLQIGEDCMFSDNVTIWCADGHALIDKKTGDVINLPPSCLKIGNHVWVGYGAKIIKNAELPDNSVLSAFSLLTKKYTEKNIVLGGTPAKIIKTNIAWSRSSCEDYIKQKDMEHFND